MNLTKAFFIIALASLITFGFKKVQAPKTYTVSLSVEQWNQVIQIVDSSAILLNESDLPARKVIWASQGLASINQAIKFQVSAQITAEQKKDSTNAVKPKSK